MSETEDRLAQIQARADACQSYNFGMRNADKLAHEDIPALLAMVRERDAALERALSACDRIITNADGHKPPGPPNPTREQATAAHIRAAITATEGV